MNILRRIVLCGALMALVACATTPRPSIVDRAEQRAKRQLKHHTELCAAANKHLADDTAAGSYIEARLRVVSSRDAGLKPKAELLETAFADVIRAGGPRIMLLMARGGLGKSRLSKALTARVCNTRAVVQVDLNWELAQPGASAARLAAVVEKKLLGSNSADPTATIRSALSGRRLLLLLDSLDEVTLAKRPAVVKAVEDFLAPSDRATAIVFTRPPVFTANYGFAQVSARVEIPTLNCDATRRALRLIIGDDQKLTTFLEFTKQYGLDRMVLRAGGSCRYPHMSTYRDIIVLRQIANNIAKAAPAKGALLSSRAAIYEFLVTVSVIKDLAGLKLMPADLMALVDRMVAAQTTVEGQRNLGFTVGACLAQVKKVDGQQARQVCERLLQSSLFKSTARLDVWQLRNQSVGDLFLAREMNQDLNKAGDCSSISRNGAMLESNEVAGFLVGMDGGQRCLLPLVQELCTRSGLTPTNLELLDQGLPPGQLRATALNRAKSAAGEAADSDVCFAKTLRALTHDKLTHDKTPVSPSPAASTKASKTKGAKKKPKCRRGARGKRGKRGCR